VEPFGKNQSVFLTVHAEGQAKYWNKTDRVELFWKDQSVFLTVQWTVRTVSMLRSQLNTEIKHLGWTHFGKTRAYSSLSMLRGQINTKTKHIGWSHFRKIRVFSSLSMLRGQLNTEIKHIGWSHVLERAEGIPHCPCRGAC
jgi:hypothetical protein